MNKNDIVRVKPNHHHPSRVGQTAKIIAVTTTGEKHPTNQYFLVYEKDNVPDTMYESDLELVFPGAETIVEATEAMEPFIKAMSSVPEEKKYLEL